MQTTLLKLKTAGADMSFTGWASTPDQDRQGDIVEPGGAAFELPLPLLWAHDHRQPVGTVRDARVSPAGIRVSGKLTAAVTKAVEAWALMGDGALALSIGFSPAESEPLPGGGRRFTRWDWHELSLVSVPANPRARIGKGLVLPHPDTETPPPARTAPGSKPASLNRDTQTRLLQACARFVDKKIASIDPETFGRAMGEMLREATDQQERRIKALEEQLAGGSKDGMHYAGTFQRAFEYRRGDVVRSGDGLYFAVRDVEPGKADPQRQGSAWERLA